MKQTPDGPFCLGALALSLAALFTACQSTPTQTAAELKSLQGYWEGDGSGGKCSITITGNSLYYYGRTDFWFKTTFTLPAGTDPQQLLATIKDCSDCSQPENSSTGKVVPAIFKIEGGKLTLAADQGSGKQPTAFPSDLNSPVARYDLKKVQRITNHPQPNEPKTP